MELNFYKPKNLSEILKENPSCKWQYADYEPDLEVFETNLNLLKYFVLPNLMNQTNQNYKCFITYNWQLDALFKHFLSEFGKIPDHIELIPKEGPGEKRILPSIIKNYIDSISVNEKDTLAFVKWDSHFLYGLNLVKALHQYQALHKERVLLFNDGCLYQLGSGRLLQENLPPFSGFIFLCSPGEYQKYFSVYDQIHGFARGLFDQFPHGILQSVPYMLLTDENHFSGVDTLSPNVQTTLKKFIKIV